MIDTALVSQITFYVLGSITLLAHLVSFVYRWMKILEMRQKRKDKIAKKKTPQEKIRARIRKARNRRYTKL